MKARQIEPRPGDERGESGHEIQRLQHHGLAWLLAGGIADTLGAALYSIERLPFNHAIFHLFVLLGAACHFVAVYGYVLARAG